MNPTHEKEDLLATLSALVESMQDTETQVDVFPDSLLEGLGLLVSMQGNKEARETLARTIVLAVEETLDKQSLARKVLKKSEDVGADLCQNEKEFDVGAVTSIQQCEMAHNGLLQFFMCCEELPFIRQMRQYQNNSYVHLPEFTPEVVDWTIRTYAPSAAKIIMSIDLQRDIFADPAWHDIFSPAPTAALFETGVVGVFDFTGSKLSIYTDGYRYDTLRTLDGPREFYLCDECIGVYNATSFDVVVQDGASTVVSRQVQTAVTGRVVHCCVAGDPEKKD